MRCAGIAVVCVAVVLTRSEAATARLRSRAHITATVAGQSVGESKAALIFFQEWLGKLPKNMTKTKQEAVVDTLESEITKLTANVNNIKKMEMKEKQEANTTASLKEHMKNSKDKAMLESMDRWSERANEKARIGALNVISKLKNAIHLVKKGALSGNTKAADNLANVLKQMTAMSR